MHRLLRTSRAYLYTGTQPASYTLGLIEAMMTGIPVVSIGPEHMRIFPYGPDLFEGHELVEVMDEAGARDRSPEMIRTVLRALVESPDLARIAGDMQRAKAIDLFGKDKIGAEWAAYLG
jgi:hypothetical protein